MASVDNQSREQDERQPYVTLIGLFEDVIDARNAISALRRDDCPADDVSLIVRHLKSNEGGPAERHGAVARAVDEADLNGHSVWLQGLASLIVPKRGTFLVAGMLGAALAAVTVDAPEDTTESPASVVLGDFGFPTDETAYVESRLLAGTTLVGFTSNDPDSLATARERLAQNNAVHIGGTRTDEDTVRAAKDLLTMPPETYETGAVVITDVVAPLQPLVNGKHGVEWARSLQGRQVLDREGEVSGKIENLIAEACADGGPVERDQLRYVVLSFGGVLGLGRRYAAVPASFFTLDGDPIRVNVSQPVLRQAPAYDPAAPFSRREEQAVYAYFGCNPYWEGQPDSMG